jgi:DNA replication protein DnaC
MTTSSPVPRSQAVEAALPLLLKQLKLARFRSHWQPLSQQAEAEGWSPGQFLYALCEQEVDHRQIARRQRLLRDAHLPWQKGLDGFDHQHLEPKHWQELQVLSRSHTWLLQAENLLLFGPSGVGKTHLAIAITMAMIEQDQACRFFPATALVQLLQKAKASFELPALIQKLDRYALLVIDDISYVRRSELKTSNQPFREWHEILPSGSMTVAAVDRLVRHCHIVGIKGESYRQKQAAERVSIDQSDPPM